MLRSAALVQSLSARLSRLNQLAEDGELDEARELLAEVRAEASRAGLRSPYLCWVEGRLAASAGEPELAFERHAAAVVLDPAHPSPASAYEEAAEVLRQALADGAGEATGAFIPRVYALLARHGETDLRAHLALARHQRATGDAPAAARLLDAVLLLAPASAEAWALRGELAAEAGDAALEARCREAAAPALPAAAFAVPGETQRC